MDLGERKPLRMKGSQDQAPTLSAQVNCEESRASGYETCILSRAYSMVILSRGAPRFGSPQG